MTTQEILTRRRMLGGGGVPGVRMLVAGRTPVGGLIGSDTAQAATACASLTPTKTIGPYFVEEKLNRSNITTDPETSAVIAGAPLVLKLTMLDEDNACAPLSGAQVDIMQANGSGGHLGTFTVGLSSSNQSSGAAASSAAPGAAPPAGATPSGGSVAAVLRAASCTRGQLGTRTVHARLTTKAAVSLDALYHSERCKREVADQDPRLPRAQGLTAQVSVAPTRSPDPRHTIRRNHANG